ncbi:MAG: hypothetical protein H7Z37_06300 [Pyrinomonadaceae bacterium]|nr:hypothetical protein [Pyrinomonadaceae bacterium]
MHIQQKHAPDKERLEILLAITIAFNKRKAHLATSDDDFTNSKDELMLILSALNESDLAAITEKIEFYESLETEERQLWQARVLNRIHKNYERLDKDVHFTHIAEVLRDEPKYLQTYILQHLTQELTFDISSVLDLKIDVEKSKNQVSIGANLKELVRRNFLSRFVSREDLPKIKPLALLSGNELLYLLQQLGRNEIAFVCRGIKEIENLAPFLRQFETADAQAIVAQMSNLRSIEKIRVDIAELLVKEAWQTESDQTLVVQLIGLYKLAAALVSVDTMNLRYTTQKMPVNLAAKLAKRLEFIAEKPLDSDVVTDEINEINASEVETVAAQILLERVKEAQTI